jgi:hypothetical protein
VAQNQRTSQPHQHQYQHQHPHQLQPQHQRPKVDEMEQLHQQHLLQAKLLKQIKTTRVLLRSTANLRAGSGASANNMSTSMSSSAVNNEGSASASNQIQQQLQQQQQQSSASQMQSQMQNAKQSSDSATSSARMHPSDSPNAQQSQSHHRHNARNQIISYAGFRLAVGKYTHYPSSVYQDAAAMLSFRRIHEEDQSALHVIDNQTLIKQMKRSLRKQPIQGFVHSNRQKFADVQSKVNDIRQLQERVFIQERELMSELQLDTENYDSASNSFHEKEEKLEVLHKMLDALCLRSVHMIDQERSKDR